MCNPLPGQPNCRFGFRFETADPTRGDLTGDGDAGDTVLSVLGFGVGQRDGRLPRERSEHRRWRGRISPPGSGGDYAGAHGVPQW